MLTLKSSCHKKAMISVSCVVEMSSCFVLRWRKMGLHPILLPTSSQTLTIICSQIGWNLIPDSQIVMRLCSPWPDSPGFTWGGVRRVPLPPTLPPFWSACQLAINWSCINKLPENNPAIGEASRPTKNCLGVVNWACINSLP